MANAVDHSKLPRTAGNYRSEHEIHLVPDHGNIDFEALYTQLKIMGYTGWFSLEFGNDADGGRNRGRHLVYTMTSVAGLK